MEVLFRNRVLGIQFDTSAVIVQSHVLHSEGVRVGDDLENQRCRGCVSRRTRANQRVIEAVKRHASRPLRVVFLRHDSEQQRRQEQSPVKAAPEQKQQKNPFSGPTSSTKEERSTQEERSTKEDTSEETSSPQQRIRKMTKERRSPKQREFKTESTKRLYSKPMSLSERMPSEEKETYITNHEYETRVFASSKETCKSSDHFVQCRSRHVSSGNISSDFDSMERAWTR